MFIHYFKTAIRNLFRNKVYSLINLLGLAIGMGVCLLIYQYINFELSYDQFHENAQNIYRLTVTGIRDGKEFQSTAYTSYAVGVKGKEMIPEIEDFVRIHPQIDPLVVSNKEKNEHYQEINCWYVDSNFLQMFNFPIKYGNGELALSGKYNVVITEQMALKYFGDTNPLGKELQVSGGKLSGNFMVTGVLKTLPMNSHLQFDFLFPMEFLLENERTYSEGSGWDWYNFVTYVLVNKTAVLDKVTAKFEQVFTTHIGDNSAKSNDVLKTRLQSMLDIHLKSDYSEDFGANNGDIQNIRLFSIIAIFILLMAWVNYINLSSVSAMRRAKEVGVRKSIGAVRKQLVVQFMIESSLINVIAAILSIFVAYLMLPALNNIIGRELELSVLHNQRFWLWFFLVIIFGTLFSGLYPAFVLSSSKPISVLKSIKVGQKGGLNLRRGLIVFQFLISVLLISGTYLIYSQVIFMKNQDLGIDMEKILVLKGPSTILEIDRSLQESKFQFFKDKVVSHHSISAVSGSGSVPGKGSNGTTSMWKLGAPIGSSRRGNIVFVDFDFNNTYSLEFLAGRPFTQDMLLKGNEVIINEEAVRTFGLGNPENALQEELVIDWGDTDTARVIGVVKDFHWHSLRDAHFPNLFVLSQFYNLYFSLKMDLSNIQESIDHIQSSYKLAFPNDPFDYFFLDDNFNSQYRSDIQFRNLFTYFSILAIFISCLGLHALVSFSTTLRVKEIGIRKVFGANVGSLMAMLSREYIVLLSIAMMLAFPVIILWGRAWLNHYAFRIDIGIDLYLTPPLVLMVITFLTVAYRTYTSARINPVKSLKVE